VGGKDGTDAMTHRSEPVTITIMVMFAAALFCGVAQLTFGIPGISGDTVTSPTTMHDPGWVPIVPPRSGLRCWRAGHLSYCEPDPTATFGASP
jgi:hypothetical protein